MIVIIGGYNRDLYIKDIFCDILWHIISDQEDRVYKEVLSSEVLSSS